MSWVPALTVFLAALGSFFTGALFGRWADPRVARAISLVWYVIGAAQLFLAVLMGWMSYVTR
jgi:hypothetical protein